MSDIIKIRQAIFWSLTMTQLDKLQTELHAFLVINILLDELLTQLNAFLVITHDKYSTWWTLYSTTCISCNKYYTRCTPYSTTCIPRNKYYTRWTPYSTCIPRNIYSIVLSISVYYRSDQGRSPFVERSNDSLWSCRVEHWIVAKGFHTNNQGAEEQARTGKSLLLNDWWWPTGVQSRCREASTDR